jgi:hypothetical protein
MPEPVYFGGTVNRSVGSQEIICEIERYGRKALALLLNRRVDQTLKSQWEAGFGKIPC